MSLFRNYSLNDPVEGDTGLENLGVSPALNQTLSFSSSSSSSGFVLSSMDFSYIFDALRSTDAISTFTGSASENIVTGTTDQNKLIGLAGNDTLYGLDGDDHLRAGKGNDRALGGAGNDRILGGAGNDKVNGGNGDDKLFGNSGNDRLTGGNGRDTLDGGTGNDRLNGGRDGDTFVFSPGQDIVADFDITQLGEKIDLSAATSITDLADLLTGGHLIQSGDDAIIDDLNGNTMRLLNVDISDLSATVFVF